MADETEWASAWTKMLRWTMSHGALPATFAVLDLDVPRQYTYMLSAQLNSDMPSPQVVETVKIECDGDDDPHTARLQGGQPKTPSSVRQSL